MNSSTLALYFSPFAFVSISYLFRKFKHQRTNRRTLDDSIASKLTEPASLHPVIDPNLCLGCGSCAKACPENLVLGLISGKAELINPTHCIGHGACKTACPMDAITLVFGTETRGVDIPTLDEEFQTNIPGIYIAGELGGMGLIRNATNQGKQAVNAMAKLDGMGSSTFDHDIVIIGAGPAGISATLAAKQHKLRYATLEQESLGGTVAHYPRGKIVMTAPAELPLVGKVKFTETTKETLLDFWRKVEKEQELGIRYQERVENIEPFENGFIVTTANGTYKTRSVLMAIGRRGTPRKLGVPGEKRTKVVYRLIDSSQYQGKHMLVVGGGDSALEAAVSLSEEPGTTVTLSYRSEAFSRAKEKNRQKVTAAESAGNLRVLLKSNVSTILDDKVFIDHDGEEVEIPNDGVIVSAGGILPTPFLKSIGINIDTKYGTV
ncbi:MAG: NAD(P)-binding domain-containing protein [Candidatus Sedimenticola sp. 20ELBAFRAG]